MRPEKKQLAQDIGEMLKSSEHLFLVGYKGLSVAAFDSLRDDLASQGAECHVVPNRLFRIAANDTDFKSIAEAPVVKLDNAVVVGGDDPVAVAKALKKFSDGNECLSVKAGVLEGTFLQAEEVGALADLPSREVLLAQLLGVLQAPARNLVSALSQKKASVVYALKSYLDQKQSQ
ncbi:MAG: 50S ribosomal protein L10 [Lentisphaeria bacterium]